MIGGVLGGKKETAFQNHSFSDKKQIYRPTQPSPDSLSHISAGKGGFRDADLAGAPSAPECPPAFLSPWLPTLSEGSGEAVPLPVRAGFRNGLETPGTAGWQRSALVRRRRGARGGGAGALPSRGMILGETGTAVLWSWSRWGCLSPTYSTHESGVSVCPLHLIDTVPPSRGII